MLEFFEGYEAFEFLVDAAFSVQHIGPGRVEPVGDLIEAPLPHRIGDSGFVQVALDFVGVVLHFDVDEVGLSGMSVLKFGHGIHLGAAGGGGAEGGGGKHHDGGPGVFDGAGNADQV